MNANADPNFQTRTTNLARIRGGLHDLGLTSKSPETLRWVDAALQKLSLDYPIAVVSLPDEALAAMANAIEHKVLLQAGLAERRDTAA